MTISLLSLSRSGIAQSNELLFRIIHPDLAPSAQLLTSDTGIRGQTIQRAIGDNSVWHVEVNVEIFGPGLFVFQPASDELCSRLEYNFIQFRISRGSADRGKFAHCFCHRNRLQKRCVANVPELLSVQRAGASRRDIGDVTYTFSPPLTNSFFSGHYADLSLSITDAAGRQSNTIGARVEDAVFGCKQAPANR